jgi:hemerythrin superfamily protein
MDAVDAIMNDHRVLEGLFEQVKADRENRAALLAEVRARLTAHSRAEERYVYPALVRARPDEKGEVHHGAEEHREAEELLAAAESATDAEFGPAFDKFVKAVRHHVREEETDILPSLRESVSSRKRGDLGQKFDHSRIRELRRAGIDETLTKEDLYVRAQKARIPGRSGMSKAELTRALLVAKTGKKSTTRS